jgi:hypothetical protein
MLSAGTLGKSKRVPDLRQLIALFLAEKYTKPASDKPDLRAGLLIQRLRKDHVRAAEARLMEMSWSGHSPMWHPPSMNSRGVKDGKPGW